MDLPAALDATIHDLCSGVCLGPDSIIDPLRALGHDLQLLTRSYLGLQVVLSEEDRTITLTSFGPMVAFEDIASSLYLPLAMLAPTARPGGALTLYAAAPGAFVDLAADLTYAHRSVHRLRLDQDLVPRSVTSGVRGLDEVSRVNKAIGWLVDRGYELEVAPRALACGAAVSGSTILDYATGLVGTGERR